MNNCKGMSLWGLLLAVLIVMILLKMALPQYQKAVVKSQQQTQQTLKQVQDTLQQAEKAAAHRADTDLNF